ncbi:VWA domain-containing protein [candidate division KSB1 bacterium]|nr:VWA domain-containing protein [candidate division KSB1 bacterium]
MIHEPDHSIFIRTIKLPEGGIQRSVARFRRDIAHGDGTGRYERAVPYKKAPFNKNIAIFTTILNAARRMGGKSLHRSIKIIAGDLAVKIRSHPNNLFIVFLVDSSESMNSDMRMRAAKGAVLGLLRRAYLQRLSVAMIAMGGDRANVLLPRTTSVRLALKKLYKMPTGGATPFADGLVKARQLINTARKQNILIEPVLFILSDGEANVPLQSGRNVKKELLNLANQMRKERFTTIVIDTSSAAPNLRELPYLAKLLGADYFFIKNLRPEGIVACLRPGNKRFTRFSEGAQK